MRDLGRRPDGMLRVTSAYTNLAVSPMKAISHCSTFKTFEKGTRVQDEMAGHQMRRCNAPFFFASMLTEPFLVGLVQTYLGMSSMMMGMKFQMQRANG
jgi:hypothetical protein